MGPILPPPPKVAKVPSAFGLVLISGPGRFLFGGSGSQHAARVPLTRQLQAALRV